jgi:hypothetical protein
MVLEITEFYDTSGVILGEGISGSVKICQHKEVHQHFLLIFFFIFVMARLGLNTL